MAPWLSPKHMSLLHLLLLICFISTLASAIKLAISPANVTLFGDAVASFKNNTISLTREFNGRAPRSSSCAAFISEIGRAFYKHPIRFLDPCKKTAASFRCKFTFSYIRSPTNPASDGFAFVVASDIESLILSQGYMGLPDHKLFGPDSYLVVGFGKGYLIPFHYVFVTVNSMERDKIAIFDDCDSSCPMIWKNFTSWIEYDDSTKKITIWVGESRFHRPSEPLTVADIEFMHFKEFMRIGLSASNEHGSAAYTLQQWDFETFDFDDNESSSTSNTSSGHNLFDNYRHHERIWVMIAPWLLVFLILVAVIFYILFSSLATTSFAVTEKKKRRRRRGGGEIQ